MDKLSSVVDRMQMELIETNFENRDPAFFKAPGCECYRWCHSKKMMRKVMKAP